MSNQEVIRDCDSAIAFIQEVEELQRSGIEDDFFSEKYDVLNAEFCDTVHQFMTMETVLEFMTTPESSPLFRQAVQKMRDELTDGLERMFNSFADKARWLNRKHFGERD